MAKVGFGGQWIEIAKVGKFLDSKGVVRDLTPTLLKQAVDNFDHAQIEAPLTIGHPRSGDPAHGWIEQLRMNGDAVEMKAKDTSEPFEQMVRDGLFRTRSAGIYLSHPSMKTPVFDHVAFLGAEPPAVKGLKPIQFTENADGESFTVETTINLQEKKMEEKDLDQLPESFWDKFKSKLGIKTELKEGGNAATEPTSFSQADLTHMLAEAVAAGKEAAKVEFAEQLKTSVENLDSQIKTLTESASANSAAGRRSEIVQFVESIPGEKGKHYLKRAGVVEFLESLATADAADKAPAVVCFSEGKDGSREEVKSTRLDWAKTLLCELPVMIEFGEKFGNIQAGPDADKMVDASRVKELEDQMGVKEKAAGGEK